MQVIVVDERDPIDTYATAPVDAAHIQYLFNTDASNDDKILGSLSIKIITAGNGWCWLPWRDEDKGLRWVFSNLSDHLRSPSHSPKASRIQNYTGIRDVSWSMLGAPYAASCGRKG